MRRPGLFLAFGLVLAAAAAATVTMAAAGKEDAKDEKGATIEEARKYIPVTRTELNQNQAQFIGQYVEVKDLFDTPVGNVPAVLVRNGITQRNYFIFYTHPLDGANLLCFVPRDNEFAQPLFKEPVVQGTKILLRGQVGDMVAGRSLLKVDEIYRGWEAAPTEVKINIIVKLAGSPSGKEYTYKIPELNKQYKVVVPGVSQPVYMRILRQDVEGK